MICKSSQGPSKPNKPTNNQTNEKLGNTRYHTDGTDLYEPNHLDFAQNLLIETIRGHDVDALAVNDCRLLRSTTTTTTTTTIHRRPLCCGRRREPTSTTARGPRPTGETRPTRRTRGDGSDWPRGRRVQPARRVHTRRTRGDGSDWPRDASHAKDARRRL